MQYHQLTFEDIMQPKILYYDPEVNEACINICETLKIDNMPDYDSKHYWEFVDGAFRKKVINDEIKLQLYDCIFDVKPLAKLKKNNHNVLFVYSGNLLKGIVHFSDYNRNVVLKRIQDDVLHFEFNLREYLGKLPQKQYVLKVDKSLNFKTKKDEKKQIYSHSNCWDSQGV